MKATLILAGVLLAFSAGASAAQTLVRVEADRNYRLTYTDLLGQTHTVIIEPADKINPVVEASVSLTPGGTRYDYSVWNLAEPMPAFDIFSLRVPCHPAGVVSSDARLVGNHVDSPVCVFITFNEPLQPGGFADGYIIDSTALPALTILRLSGLIPPVPWPSEEGMIPSEVDDLVSSIQAGLDGWATVPGIAPLRLPGELGGPDELLALIQGDLAEVCGPLGWIGNPGICTSLGAKLAAAAQSLAAGRPGPARGSLNAFLQELDAQHGDEPGKHVNQNAYALLRVNVEYLLSLLPAPLLPTVTAALIPVPDKSLKHNKGTFTVAFSCEGGTVTSATLNGVDVENGDEVELNVKSGKSEKSRKSDKRGKSNKSEKSAKSLKLEGADFLLEVSCENESGVSTATAEPEFPEKSSKSKRGG